MNDEDQNGMTPLVTAVIREETRIIEQLLANGARIDHRNDLYGFTALHYAARFGKRSSAEALIAHGADIAAKDKWDYQPIHWAAYHDRPEIIELLIAKGVDVNAKTSLGQTPLQLAQERRNTETVELLRHYSGSAAVKTESKALKVLFVGNSYTGGIRDTLNNLIGASPYSESTIAYVVKGGWTLQQHLNDSGTISRIQSTKWDYVVLQEQSKAPTLPEKCDEFYDAVIALSAIIRQCRSKPVLYMTWGRRDKDKQNPQINPNYETMQMRLTRAYADAAKKADVLIAPVGEAWRAVRRERSRLGSQLYRDDGSHPSKKGAYLAACVFYATLFKEDPMQLDFISSLSVSEAEYLKGKAVEAVRRIDRDGS